MRVKAIAPRSVSSVAATRVGRARRPHSGYAARAHGHGAEGEDAGENGGPGCGEGGAQPSETPCGEGDECEGRDSPRGPDPPVDESNAAEEAPLEAGAEHRADPTNREGARGREGAQQRAIKHLHARTEQHARQQEREPARQDEIPGRRSAPGLPGEPRRRDAGDGDEREREHRSHAANVRERLTLDPGTSHGKHAPVRQAQTEAGRTRWNGRKPAETSATIGGRAMTCRAHTRHASGSTSRGRRGSAPRYAPFSATA